MPSNDIERRSDIVTVTLQDAPFGRTARVSRNTDTTENIISELMHRNKQVSEEVCNSVLSYYCKELIERIRDGHSVEIRGIGTLYITAKVSQDGNQSPSCVEGFGIGFTPNKELLAAANSLVVDKVVPSQTVPRIDAVFSMSDKVATTLKTASLIGIKGELLKLVGSDSGLYFAPITSTGDYNTDKSTWIKVNKDNIYKNTAGNIAFLLERGSIQAGDYKAIIYTRYVKNSKKESSRLKCGVSCTVHINDA